MQITKRVIIVSKTTPEMSTMSRIVLGKNFNACNLNVNSKLGVITNNSSEYIQQTYSGFSKRLNKKELLSVK